MRKLLSCICLLSTLSCPLSAAYLYKDGKFIESRDIATHTVEEHYNRGIAHIEKKEWEEAVTEFRIVTINFPLSSWGQEGFYFLGVAYYHAGDKEMANNSFSTYLKENQNPQYFEETFRYKLAIADAFAKGDKKHLWGVEKLPQWVGAEDLAVSIYDEIITSLPNHELAAKTLLSKATLLNSNEQYKESIEAYQALIRKFPKSEFAAKSYAEISRVYLQLARLDVNNPDILPLAEINIKRFSLEFPKDPQIESCKQHIQEMKELFANALYETGLFYERKGQPKASVLYYHSSIQQFPETKISENCKARLKQLQPYADEINIPTA